jgi:hypothetical protein
MKCLTVNPFLFIRGHSCPCCIQASLSLNCLHLTYTWISSQLSCILRWPWLYKKNPMSSIGLEIRPQSAFSAFRALQPSANYFAEWSGRVWQLSADGNGLMAHHYCQQRAVTPDPETFNSNKKGTKLPLLSAEGCHTRLDGQHCPLITYQGVFFKGGDKKPSDDINSWLFLMNKKGFNALDNYVCAFN